MIKKEFTLKQLPPVIELETPAVFRKVAVAHRYLAELKGMASSIPNESILIHTLALQEAKDSSAIENINELVALGLLEKQKIWKTNFYINVGLLRLFTDSSNATEPVEPIRTINPTSTDLV